MATPYEKWGFGRMLRFLITPERQEEPEWTRPPQEDYHRSLHYDGFITSVHWEDDDLSEYPMLVQDLEDLEQYLLPVFWEFNQKARHYQRRFYFYQRIFMIAAFLTTLVSVFNSFLYSVEGVFGWEIAPLRIGNFAATVTSIFSILTAVISARASYFTLMTNYREPRKRWARYRRLSEELRITYFRYLARIEPYQTDNRVEQLRRDVLTIRQQERDNGQ